MNPLKCAFGVTSAKFLGFLARHEGIEIDQAKIKGIQEMPAQNNLKNYKVFKVFGLYWNVHIQPSRSLPPNPPPHEEG